MQKKMTYSHRIKDTNPQKVDKYETSYLKQFLSNHCTLSGRIKNRPEIWVFSFLLDLT